MADLGTLNELPTLEIYKPLRKFIKKMGKDQMLDVDYKDDPIETSSGEVIASIVATTLAKYGHYFSMAQINHEVEKHGFFTGFTWQRQMGEMAAKGYFYRARYKDEIITFPKKKFHDLIKRSKITIIDPVGPDELLIID